MKKAFEIAIVLFNVSKSCLGAGIYNYPEMFRLYGPKIVLALIILSGIASLFGAFAYINLNRKFHKSNSISTLSLFIISPFFKYFVDFVVITKCIAVAAGYMNLASSIISKLPFKTGFEYIDNKSQFKGRLIVFLCSTLLIPSTLQPSLIKLKNFSYLGIFSIFALIIISIIQTKDRVADISNLPIDNNIFKDIGTFVFGFTCHQSILNIHNETQLRDNVIKIVITIAFVLVGIFYYSFGYINYIAFGDHFSDLNEIFSIWMNYHSTLAYLGALIFSLSLIVSIPFQIHPAKTYLGDMLSFKSLGRFVSVISMMIFCYSLSIARFYNIQFVSRFVTKPMNTCLCFAFPLILTLLNKGKKTSFEWLICLYLAIFSGICIVSFF